MFTFQKATKANAKLRLAIFGPSGSGKTFTSLRLATGMGGRTAVIDTERGSASKYADRFAFDLLDLQQRTIDDYIGAIKAGGKAGYEILIVDSLTHAWHELLQEVDRLANSKYRGNTWSAWSEGTPKQRELVEAILAFPGHMIVTMRTKTEWTSEQDKNGRVKPVRVGLAPEQGKGLEYEFDLLMEISPSHVVNVIKDRTGVYQDKTLDKPGEDFGQELMRWLNSGEASAPAPVPHPPSTPVPASRAKLIARLGELHQEARALGLAVQPLDPTAPDHEIVAVGKALAANIAQIKAAPPAPANGADKSAGADRRSQWQAFCKEVGATEAHIRAALGQPRVSEWISGAPGRTLEQAMALVRETIADFQEAHND